jgi:diaminohydroxyphosphoribosylaminopyrimidine deaminase/5-amino-6-(5-phosphoribosylamino)uracil reductase
VIGKTRPNPIVGCVVVNDAGEVVGEGFHPKAGEPHAEVFALRDAGDRAKGATAYVSLEPCNHTGRTPPCVDALLKAGVRSVALSTWHAPAENDRSLRWVRGISVVV